MKWTKVEPQKWEVDPGGQEERRTRPKLHDPNYNELRSLTGAVGGFFLDSVPAGTTILDYGCGDRPYEPLLPPGCRYIGVDILPNPSADVISDRRWGLPIADGVVDTVLSTQVLQHAEDFDLYLSECNRVLKPGGTLFLTAPATYSAAGPYDYWRFTPTGLAVAIERHGFQVEKMDPLIGVFGTTLFLRSYTYSNGLRRRGHPMLARWLTVVMNLRINLVERLWSRFIWASPMNLACTARKVPSEDV